MAPKASKGRAAASKGGKGRGAARLAADGDGRQTRKRTGDACAEEAPAKREVPVVAMDFTLSCPDQSDAQSGINKEQVRRLVNFLRAKAKYYKFHRSVAKVAMYTYKAACTYGIK
jgi:hypothetical protein